MLKISFLTCYAKDHFSDTCYAKDVISGTFSTRCNLLHMLSKKSFLIEVLKNEWQICDLMKFEILNNVFYKIVLWHLKSYKLWSCVCVCVCGGTNSISQIKNNQVPPSNLCVLS